MSSLTSRLTLLAVSLTLIVPALIATAPDAPSAPDATTATSTTTANTTTTAPADTDTDTVENASTTRAAGPVKVQLLALNDLHGHLEHAGKTISARTGTSRGAGFVPAGGADYLAAHVRAAEKANPATAVISAGDLIGGSPMLSGYYHDEPTVEAMNQILDVGVVGNHEFDEGTAEMRRMIAGGCHPKDGCQDGTGFAGTKFALLGANVFDRRTGKPILPGYTIKNIGGAQIGFIGTVTIDTPGLVDRNGIPNLEFRDEAATVRSLLPKVRAAGADAVVVLTHSGGTQAKGGINECNGTVGSAVDLAKALSGKVDAVVSGHTHQPYVCRYGSTLLTSAASYGRLLTKINLTVDTTANRVTARSAKNVVVTHKVTPDPGVSKTIRRYQKLIAPIANRTVGNLSREANRTKSASGETVLGNLVADSQLHATKAASKGGAQVALAPQGLIRTNLNKGKVTYGEVYSALPFAHNLVTMTLTGRQLDKVLETQFCHPSAVGVQGTVPLAVSKGFTYKYDPDAACGQRVRIRDFRLNGATMTADGTYRVTINSLFASGESGFDILKAGKKRVTTGLERDALAKYLTANPKITLPARNRVALR